MIHYILRVMQPNYRIDDTIVHQEGRGIQLRSELPWEARFQLPHLPTPENAKSGGVVLTQKERR